MAYIKWNGNVRTALEYIVRGAWNTQRNSQARMNISCKTRNSELNMFHVRAQRGTSFPKLMGKAPGLTILYKLKLRVGETVLQN